MSFLYTYFEVSLPALTVLCPLRAKPVISLSLSLVLFLVIWTICTISPAATAGSSHIADQTATAHQQQQQTFVLTENLHIPLSP